MVMAMTIYDSYLDKLEYAMKAFLAESTAKPDDLYNMLNYHMGWTDKNFQKKTKSTGKRVRPLLLLLCYEALVNNWEPALPAAIAIEFLHNFTLIHDDIEDQDTVRHGRPTLWTIWGVPQAINAGDALYALSYRALLSLNADTMNKKRMIKTVKIFTDTILRITEGQFSDIYYESKSIISEEDYLTMIAGKTAALFGLACELAAQVANVQRDIREKLKDFGIALGMAFQMQDDILGLWGDEKHTGKPVGSDLVKRKKTLPIIHCSELNSEFHKLTSISITETDITKAMELLDITGSYEYAVNKVNLYLNIALDALDAALEPARQSNIHPLITSLMYRQK
jgi:geranylgeranyl diphosphate synthase type I